MARPRNPRAVAKELLAELKRKASAVTNRLNAQGTSRVYVGEYGQRTDEHGVVHHDILSSSTRARWADEYPENSINEMRRLYWDAVELRNLAIKVMETANNRLAQLQDPQGYGAAVTKRDGMYTPGGNVQRKSLHNDHL